MNVRTERVPSIIRHALRAMMLDEDFYNRAEVEDGLNRQAAAIVIVASALGGVGSAIAQDASIVASMVGGVVAGVVGWLLWAWASWKIGTLVFGGQTTFGSMVRVIGFAFAPFVIGVVPWLGFPAAVWVLFASLMAVREGLNVDTPRALGTVAVGWVVWLVITILLNLVLGLSLNARWPFP